MKQERFKIKVGEEELAAVKLTDQRVKEADLLILHGAGKATKERFIWIAEEMLNKGTGSVLFDFSGHGESTGELSASSLAKRQKEAESALAHVNKPVAVLGSSMGAYTSIKITKIASVHTLILFAPAIYSKKAWNAPFNEEFTKIIRQPSSWRDSDALDVLDNFEGNLFIAIGDEDEVIPSGVIDLLDAHSSKVKNKEIMRLPGCTHNIHQCFSDNTEAKVKMLKTISGMINTGKG